MVIGDLGNPITRQFFVFKIKPWKKPKLMLKSKVWQIIQIVKSKKTKILKILFSTYQTISKGTQKR